MTERDWLANKFEENRGHMRAVAYRMLGSATEADDAVQEAWLRVARSDTAAIQNLSAWLTTVVARICLDMLRSRNARKEDELEDQIPEPAAPPSKANDPEREAVLADSIGLALLVVLDRLTPPERIAFVLHDMFAVPFEDIAEILGRTVAATRQLASRARKRVQGGDPDVFQARHEQRAVVEAFLKALKAGDFQGLIAVLDPDVAVRLDGFSGRPGSPREIHGAKNWALGATAFSQLAQFVEPALVDGAPGLVFAPAGHLERALRFVIENGKIAQAEIIGDPERIRTMEVAILGE